MRRLYLFFVFVSAACSPVNYSGGQTAKSVSMNSSEDSAAVRRLVDQAIHDELQKRMDIKEWTEQTTVEETFSAPDSTGAQHVEKRSTTTLSKRSHTSAESAQSKDTKREEKVDSVSQKGFSTYIEKEEEKFVKGKVDRIIPWYVWPLLFIGAAIVVLFMWKHKGWFSMIV